MTAGLRWGIRGPCSRVSREAAHSTARHNRTFIGACQRARLRGLDSTQCSKLPSRSGPV